MTGPGADASSPETAPERVDPPEQWRDFRRARHAELAEPFGWLCLTGFHWLPQDPSPLPGLPGRWSADAARARVEAEAGELLMLDGTELDGRSEQSVAPTARAPWLEYEGARIEVLNRGGRYAIRIRVASTPQREAFTSVPTFAWDENWVIEADFHPYDPERIIDVATIRADLRQQLTAVGEVHFSLGGQVQRLAATRIKDGMSIEFHDPTNGEATPAWRQLKFDDPVDGRVCLDFNRTIDMWFAFTGYATCPAPLDGQAITVPVTAGEMLA
ncbi:MAG: DUF1684 domain-containing protein [Actinomycetales bacterium]